MLKRIKTFILALLMILPLAFMFSGCKGNNDANGPGTEQNPPNPDVPPIPQQGTYVVSVDYALPEKLSNALENFNATRNTQTSYVLPTFTGTNFDKYFEGWFYKSNDEKINETSIKGSNSETISIYAKWNSDIENTYYSDGLIFECDSANKTAAAISYSGNDQTIVLPKVLEVDNEIYFVDSIESLNGGFSKVRSVIILGDEIDVGDSTFENSNLTSFDFSKLRFAGENSFKSTKITEAIFSDKLQRLAVSSFENCSLLSRVDLSKCNETFNVIESYLFAGCSRLNEVKFSDYIKNVSEFSFKECLSLESVLFLNLVNQIGNEAFIGCAGVKEIMLPENMISIGVDVFANNSSLEKVHLSSLFTDNAQSMSSIFGNSVSLIKEVVLEGSRIDTVPERYFADCSSLERFVMNDSIVSVKAFAFENCSKLLNIKFSENIGSDFNANAFYDTAWYKQNDELLIINKIVLLAPLGLPETLESIDFKNATSIAKGVFRNNSIIKKVTLPSSLKTIEDNAFNSCPSLEEVLFEEDSQLLTIGSQSFYNCNNLTKINLAVCLNLTTIKDLAFSKIGEVEKFILPYSITSLKFACFADSKIGAFEINGENSKFACEEGVIYKMSNGVKVSLYSYPIASNRTLFVIPNDVKEICEAAFLSTTLEVVYIQSSVSFESRYGDDTSTAFDGSNVIILLEQDSVTIPLNCNWNVYRKLNLSAGDYEIVNNSVVINVQFSEDLYGKYFVLLNESEGDFCVIIEINNGQITSQNDISDKIF